MPLAEVWVRAWVWAQSPGGGDSINMPSGGSGAGTPLAGLKAAFDPILNGGWTLVLVIIGSVVLPAALVFYVAGHAGGNAARANRGRAMFASVVTGALMFVLALGFANYFLHHPVG